MQTKYVLAKRQPSGCPAEKAQEEILGHGDNLITVDAPFKLHIVEEDRIHCNVLIFTSKFCLGVKWWVFRPPATRYNTVVSICLDL